MGGTDRGDNGEGDGAEAGDLGRALADLFRGGWRIRDIGELSVRQFFWVTEAIQQSKIIASTQAVQMERLAIASCFSKEGDQALQKTLKQLERITEASSDNGQEAST